MLVALNLVRFLDLLQNMPGFLSRVLGAEVRLGDQKLIAPKPEYIPFRTYALPQPLRYFLQKHIADIMTKRIVDRFEPVQIDEEYRPRLPSEKRFLEVALQPVPVRQPGKRIAVSHPFQHIPVQKDGASRNAEHKERDKGYAQQQNDIGLN
ncbi:hypothetical protein D3C71_1394090 [compost metagenome]